MILSSDGECKDIREIISMILTQLFLIDKILCV